jgi:hypothetical protein
MKQLKEIPAAAYNAQYVPQEMVRNHDAPTVKARCSYTLAQQPPKHPGSQRFAAGYDCCRHSLLFNMSSHRSHNNMHCRLY